MLLTNLTTSISTTGNSRLSSPTGEISEENFNTITSYLQLLAGHIIVESDAVLKDHCYARPWNWKPENIYVKPIKKLFFSKNQNGVSKDVQNQEESINVENIDSESLVPPFDLSRTRQIMNEFQRVANFVRTEDTDDWEERIDKVLWSPVQIRVFNRIIRIFNSERLARLAKVNSPHEPIVRRTSIDSTAKKFRETLASANWDYKITQWLHSLFFDNLPQDYLAIYLDILQSLRHKIPQLIDKMIAVQPNVNSKSNCSLLSETFGPLLKKSWDPVGPVLNTNKPKKLPGNPILIIVSNGISNEVSFHQQKWIAQLGNLGMVVAVTPHLALTANKITMINGVEQLVQSCRAKIQDVRVDYPGRPIILLGFNSGAALACQIGQLEHITAIVCLGFPFNTVDGKRGTPEDMLLDIRCPVMFIVGQNSTLARVDDIEDIRERMLVPTSLVVVGSADDHLRISTSKKMSEKINQSMVNRCIIDEIGDFIGGILLQPHPLPLRSQNSINSYENRVKRAEMKKRKISTSSSVDSEPPSPIAKKFKTSQSAHQVIPVAGNKTNVATNTLPRGTLVTLKGTASTQTPRKRSKNYSNQNYSEQLVTSRLTPQQKNLENTTGGITLNIGSLASLAPVGPIRFEPASISLQTSPSNKTSNTIKTSNAFIKVSKNSQVNIAGNQNIAKIKMIMPAKKVSRASIKNVTDKANDMHLVNTPVNISQRVNTSTPTVANIKLVGSKNPLPSIHTLKTITSGGSVVGKMVSTSNVHFTPKQFSTASTTATTTTAATETSTKVAATDNLMGCSSPIFVVGQRKTSITASTTTTTTAAYRGRKQQDQLPNRMSSSSLTGLTMPSNTTATASTTNNKKRTPKTIANKPVTKISLKSLNKQLTARSSPYDDNNLTCNFKSHNNEITSRSTDTSLNYNPKIDLASTLDEDFTNILDIPIVIAKEDGSLDNLQRLSPIPQISIALPLKNENLTTISEATNIFVPRVHEQNKSKELHQTIKMQHQPDTIKYTKIILTKGSTNHEQNDKNKPIILTKNNRRNKFTTVVDTRKRVDNVKTIARTNINQLEAIQNVTERNYVASSKLDRHLF